MTVIMPAADASADAVVGILQRQAKRRRHAQPLGRLEEGIGRGLAAGHSRRAPRTPWKRCRQAMRSQMTANRRHA